MVKLEKILSSWFPVFILFSLSPVPGAFGQQYDWLKTARIFLIEAYQPPFAPKLEIDAGEVGANYA